MTGTSWINIYELFSDFRHLRDIYVSQETTRHCMLRLGYVTEWWHLINMNSWHLGFFWEERYKMAWLDDKDSIKKNCNKQDFLEYENILRTSKFFLMSDVFILCIPIVFDLCYWLMIVKDCFVKACEFDIIAFEWAYFIEIPGKVSHKHNWLILSRSEI